MAVRGAGWASDLGTAPKSAYLALLARSPITQVHRPRQEPYKDGDSR